MNAPSARIFRGVIWDLFEITDDEWDDYRLVHDRLYMEPEDYGYSACCVIHRLSDDTFWMYSYTQQSDYNTLDDAGEEDLGVQVWPRTVRNVVYVTEKPND